MRLVLDANIFISAFYSWRGFNTPRLCRGYKGIKPESNTTREQHTPGLCPGVVDWGGNPQSILNRIIEGIDTLFISNEILDEVTGVMSRPKFKSSPEMIDTYKRTIEKIGRKIYIRGNVTGISRDKDDDSKIECGMMCHADFIITGDDDLLVLEEYNGIKIITPKKYLEIVNGAVF